METPLSLHRSHGTAGTLYLLLGTWLLQRTLPLLGCALQPHVQVPQQVLTPCEQTWSVPTSSEAKVRGYTEISGLWLHGATSRASPGVKT